MILQQVRDEMNQVNWVLDRFESDHRRLRGKRERRELLEMAAHASIRGVARLVEEQWTSDLGVSDDDVYRSLEMMRQDQALLRAFVTAECRLLTDIGVSPEAVDRVKDSLENVLLTLEGPATPEESTERLLGLLQILQRDLTQLEADAHDELVRDRLIGVIEALAGGLIVGGDTAAGTAGVPVTFGLSAVGAAVSVAAGTEMMGRGAQRALDS
ncbi:MAG TPA: hypothetical protein VN732_05770 [Solirubrobacterales bacterium]|nr:hypothetical protein [Solirubrobacterales bacterium]